MEEEALELITGKLRLMDRAALGGEREVEEEERCKIELCQSTELKYWFHKMDKLISCPVPGFPHKNMDNQMIYGKLFFFNKKRPKKSKQTKFQTFIEFQKRRNEN